MVGLMGASISHKGGKHSIRLCFESNPCSCYFNWYCWCAIHFHVDCFPLSVSCKTVVGIRFDILGNQSLDKLLPYNATFFRSINGSRFQWRPGAMAAVTFKTRLTSVRVSGVGGGRAQLGRRCLLEEIEENMVTESQRPTRPTVDGRSPAIVARWFFHVYPVIHSCKLLPTGAGCLPSTVWLYDHSSRSPTGGNSEESSLEHGEGPKRFHIPVRRQYIYEHTFCSHCLCIYI